MEGTIKLIKVLPFLGVGVGSGSSVTPGSGVGPGSGMAGAKGAPCLVRKIHVAHFRDIRQGIKYISPFPRAGAAAPAEELELCTLAFFRPSIVSISGGPACPGRVCMR